MHFPDVKGDWSTYSWEWHCATGRHRGMTIVYARPAIVTPASAQDIDMHYKPNYDHNMSYDMNPNQIVKTCLIMRAQNSILNMT